MEWKFECTLGVERRGYIESVMEGQGTDVTYFMRDDKNALFVLSGSLLKTLKRVSV